MLALGVGLVAASLIISMAGLVIVRRFVPHETLRENNEVAGFLIPIVGIAYAVLLAFMVIAVWQRYEAASSNVATEADELTTLFRLSAGFPDADRVRIQELTRTYARIVIEEEWPAMKQGHLSPRAGNTVNQLWQEFGKVEPKTNRESATYSEALTHLTQFNNARRERLHAVRGTVPNVIWVVLATGGILTTVFTYFFGVRSFRAQALMTAGVTIAVSISFVLVLVFNHPFRGSAPVGPDPFRQTFDVIGQPRAGN